MAGGGKALALGALRVGGPDQRLIYATVSRVEVAQPLGHGVAAAARAVPEGGVEEEAICILHIAQAKKIITGR